MIPKLTQQDSVKPEYLAFINALAKAGFAGDIESSYGSRLAVATDNSVYQWLPQAVVFPRHTADISLLTRLSSQEEFLGIRFSPRGGGTGTNGQALSDGMIVDLSRYMTRVLEVNVEEKWVRVEAGLVKDQLNDALKPYDLFFSPELSTSNRPRLVAWSIPMRRTGFPGLWKNLRPGDGFDGRAGRWELPRLSAD